MNNSDMDDPVSLPGEVDSLLNVARCRALVAVDMFPGHSFGFYGGKADLAHNYMSRFVSDCPEFFVVEDMGDRKAVNLSELGHRVAQVLQGLKIEVEQIDEKA